MYAPNESFYFALRCPKCGATGQASWSEQRGYCHYSEHRQLTFGFTRVNPDSETARGDLAYLGRVVCSDCGVDVEAAKISGSQFHSMKTNIGMREV